MSLLRNTTLTLSLLLTVLPSFAQAASEANSLEKIMAAALKFDPVKEERGDTGKAIQAYMKAGIVNKKPDLRVDYSDYYLVKKPSTFLGHQIFMIEEQYMTNYVGCCVDPGAGLTLRLQGKEDNLKDFASKNACKVKAVNITETLDYLQVNKSAPPGTYVELSCHYNDAKN